RPRSQVIPQKLELPELLPARHRLKRSQSPQERESYPFVGSATRAYLFRRVHPELLQLAGERIAPPAEQLCRFLAVSLCAFEGGADQHPLELWLRLIEQRLLAVHRMPIR